jgi:hypothetical protein
MSFNIFAAGTPSFHFEKHDCIDGGDFEPMTLVSKLSKLKKPTKENVAKYVIDKSAPHELGLLERVASMELLDMIQTLVAILAVHEGVSDGWINVSMKKSGLLLGDTTSFASYKFQPGDEPGAEFVKTIGPGLTTTSLNNWGVLGALVGVLVKFMDKLKDNDTPMLLITISH